MSPFMKLSISMVPFVSTYPGCRDAALATGFEWVWSWEDLLPGASDEGALVLDCWPLLASLDKPTRSVEIGSLVANVMNLPPNILTKVTVVYPAGA